LLRTVRKCLDLYLRTSEGWSRLIDAAVRMAPEMTAQGIANVLNVLGKIDAAAEAVSSGTGWSRLIEAAERRAPEMNNQNTANVLNARRGELQVGVELKVVIWSSKASRSEVESEGLAERRAGKSP